MIATRRSGDVVSYATGSAIHSEAAVTVTVQMPRLTRQERLITLDGSDVVVADLKSDLAVIITHPWGPLGGSLSNHVVRAAAVFFQRRNITTVRFNFAGSQIGRGITQVEQLKKIAEELLDGSLLEAEPRHVPPLPPTKLILCGYSYGSLITSSASALIPQVIATVAIAPPFAVSHWLLCFNSRYHLQQAALRKDLHRLLLIGDQDNFTSEAAFHKTISEYFPNDDSTLVTVLPGCDHFFAQPRQTTGCMEAVENWLNKIITT